MRWGGTAVVVAVALIVAATGTAFALSATVGPAGSEPAQVLRLSDLPLGYLNLELREERGDAPTCERLTEPDDTPPRMLRFVQRFHPRGCIAGYSLLFPDPGKGGVPVLVGSGVLDARNRAEADAAWAVAPEILGRLVGDRHLAPAKPASRIGTATRAFHTKAELVDGASPVSFLVWRSGNTLAAVMALGTSFSADDLAIGEFARSQQGHIAHPSPYTEAELFDGEVPLENPAIDLPVYWLGKNFRPGGGLPSNRLFDSYFPGKVLPEHTEDGFAEGPVPPLGIRYENIGIDFYGHTDWPVYAHSKTGRAITSWRCTKSRTLAVPGGTATIYGGYNRDFAKCPNRPPRAFTAWVRYGEETVVIDAPFAADSIEIVNPYGSFGGMEAIVGALRLRPPGGG